MRPRSDPAHAEARARAVEAGREIWAAGLLHLGQPVFREDAGVALIGGGATLRIPWRLVLAYLRQFEIPSTITLHKATGPLAREGVTAVLRVERPLGDVVVTVR